MEYQVIVSDRASRQIMEHVGFLANVSCSAAQQLRQTLIDALRSLSVMPQRFPFLDAAYVPSNKYRKMVVENRYLILYQIQDDTVFAEYVIDCRQDYGWLLR